MQSLWDQGQCLLLLAKITLSIWYTAGNFKYLLNECTVSFLRTGTLTLAPDSPIESAQ